MGTSSFADASSTANFADRRWKLKKALHEGKISIAITSFDRVTVGLNGERNSIKISVVRTANEMENLYKIISFIRISRRYRNIASIYQAPSTTKDNLFHSYV